MYKILMIFLLLLFTGCTHTTNSGTTYRWPATSPNKDYDSKKQSEDLSLFGRLGKTYNLINKDSVLKAARDGDITLLKESLNRYPEKVNIQDPNGDTPLIWASWKGHENIVKYLLKKGAYVNLRDNSGQSALHLAAQYNHYGIVKVLIAYNADIDLKTNKGVTPLMGAAASGNIQIVKILISSGSNINASSVHGSALTMALREKGRAKSASQKKRLENVIDYLKKNQSLIYKDKIHENSKKNHLLLRKRATYKLRVPRKFKQTVINYLGNTAITKDPLGESYLLRLRTKTKRYEHGTSIVDYFAQPTYDTRKTFVVTIDIYDLDTRAHILQGKAENTIFNKKKDLEIKKYTVQQALINVNTYSK